MSRLISRGAVLTFSRVSNFGVVIISPLLLVRILEVQAYGQYQEFMIYSMLLATACTLSLDSSVTYFVPRYGRLEKLFISQASWLTLALTSICAAILLSAKPLFLRFTSYDFVVPLAAYVFFFVNFNWLENYWVAKRRTDLVLYYSLARVIGRVSVLISVAYIWRDLTIILWSMVGVEAVRVLMVAAWLYWSRMLVLRWRPRWISEQIRFSLPLGVSSLANHAGRSIGKLFVGATAGPAALAFYAVGSYFLPVVRVVRQSISDVVFPELVRARQDSAVVLKLWQRANVMSCVLLFPAFVVLAWHAELIVTTLFTREYLPAVPVFQVYVIVIIRRCFNMDVLLRTRGKSGFILWGTILVLASNLALIWPLYSAFGLIGPAIAFVCAEVILEMYYAIRVRIEFNLTIVEMVDWRGVLKVAFGCLVGLPLLAISGSMPGPELVRAALGSLLFVAVSWFVAHRVGVTDVGLIVGYGVSRAKKLLRVS